MTGGLVPVVFLRENRTLAQQMATTVRHNRARGQHGILRMGEIVRAMLDELPADSVRRALGMDKEELERLADTTPSPEKAGLDSFGKAWVPAFGKEADEDE